MRVDRLRQLTQILLCALLASSLAGCWNRREPDTLAILESTMIDIENDGQYSLTMEFYNPASLNGNGKTERGKSKNPPEVIKKIGQSPAQSLRLAMKDLDRRIYIGHIRSRLFSEKAARTDVASPLDYYLRNPEARQNALLVVVKDDRPGRVYSCKTGLSDSVGAYLEALSNTQDRAMAKAVFVKTLDFMKDYLCEGVQPVMGLVEVEEDSGAAERSGGETPGDEKEYLLSYAGLAAFKDNRLVGFMDGDEAVVYNLLNGKFRADVFRVSDTPLEMGGPEFTLLEADQAEAKMDASFRDGRAYIRVAVKMDMTVIGEGGKTDVTKREAIGKLEHAFDEQMKSRITEVVKKAQTQFESDIFGFGRRLHIQNPKVWKEVKDNWDDYFSKASVSVEVRSDVRKLGGLEKPFKLQS